MTESASPVARRLLEVTQQARPEDLDDVRRTYAELGVAAVDEPSRGGWFVYRGGRLLADEERARTAGADAYVSKPIALMRFVEVVEGLFRPEPIATTSVIVAISLTESPENSPGMARRSLILPGI